MPRLRQMLAEQVNDLREREEGWERYRITTPAVSAKLLRLAAGGSPSPRRTTGQQSADAGEEPGCWFCRGLRGRQTAALGDELLMVDWRGTPVHTTRKQARRLCSAEHGSLEERERSLAERSGALHSLERWLAERGARCGALLQSAEALGRQRKGAEKVLAEARTVQEQMDELEERERSLAERFEMMRLLKVELAAAEAAVSAREQRQREQQEMQLQQITEAKEALGERCKALDAREAALAERSKQLSVREALLAGHGGELTAAETFLVERSRELDAREAELAERGRAADSREGALAERANEMAAREAALAERGSEMDSREAALAKRGREVEGREAALAERSRELDAREAAQQAARPASAVGRRPSNGSQISSHAEGVGQTGLSSLALCAGAADNYLAEAGRSGSLGCLMQLFDAAVQGAAPSDAGSTPSVS